VKNFSFSKGGKDSLSWPEESTLTSNFCPVATEEKGWECGCGEKLPLPSHLPEEIKRQVMGMKEGTSL